MDEKLHASAAELGLDADTVRACLGVLWHGFSTVNGGGIQSGLEQIRRWDEELSPQLQLRSVRARAQRDALRSVAPPVPAAQRLRLAAYFLENNRPAEAALLANTVITQIAVDTSLATERGPQYRGCHHGCRDRDQCSACFVERNREQELLAELCAIALPPSKGIPRT